MYDELPLWSAPFGLKLLEKVVPVRGMKVLDIGFGTGFPLIELAIRLGVSCKVYGTDPDPEAEKAVRKKIKMFKIRNIELFKSGAEKIPLADYTIDLIVSNNGLNNVQNLEQALSECHRVLRPGGTLLFTMNLPGTMHEFYEVMEEVLSEHGKEDSIMTMREHIRQKRKPLQEVVYALIQKGFSLRSSETDEFSYSFADGTTMFDHPFIRAAFLNSWLKILPDVDRDQVFGEIERRINVLAEKQHSFKLTVPYVCIESITC